jgi:hypothetical protein
MKLWALDESESQATVMKEERAERMRCACEAFKKAIELEPDDSIIGQDYLDGETALKALTAELHAERESQAKSLKAEEDMQLAAERMRGLNLSPLITNKGSPTHAAKPPPLSNKSSVMALKKLVSELREIPEFGKKAPPFASQTPAAHPIGVKAQKQATEESHQTKPDDQICTTLVESVISSPAPSPTAANRTRPPTGENLGSSPSRASPLPHVIHENMNVSAFSFGGRSLHTNNCKDELIVRLSGSVQASTGLPRISPTVQPKNPARYSQSPAPDLSPSSTQSQWQEDVKMMLVNMRTGSVESGGDMDSSDSRGGDSSAAQQAAKSEYPLYPYQPPSPSALPTPMMQSLSARLGTPKALPIASPKSIASSSIPPSSCDPSQMLGKRLPSEKHLHPDHPAESPGSAIHQHETSSSIPHSPAPPGDIPARNISRSLKQQLTEIIKGNPGTLRESGSNQPAQQYPEHASPTATHPHPAHLNSSDDHQLPRDLPDRPQPHRHHGRGEDVDRICSHSPSSRVLAVPNDHHHSPHNGVHHERHQPHATSLKKPALGGGLGLLVSLSFPFCHAETTHIMGRLRVF